MKGGLQVELVLSRTTNIKISVFDQEDVLEFLRTSELFALVGAIHKRGKAYGFRGLTAKKFGFYMAEVEITPDEVTIKTEDSHVADEFLRELEKEIKGIIGEQVGVS